MKQIRKKRPFGPLFHAQSEIKLGLVDDLLNGVHGLTDGLLRFTLELLRSAFNLKGRVAYRLADALFDCPSGLIATPLTLSVCYHDFSPE